jgi:hypothetical protein
MQLQGSVMADTKQGTENVREDKISTDIGERSKILSLPYPHLSFYTLATVQAERGILYLCFYLYPPLIKYLL